MTSDGRRDEPMKRLILILSLSTFSLLLSGCVGKSERELRNRSLPDEQKIPVVIKTRGTLTFKTLDHLVVATIMCPKWPWYSTEVTWPAGAPRIEQADLEVIDEKWMGGGRLVFRVLSGGKTLYDASICEKHQVPMARRDVMSAYGCEYPVQFRDRTPQSYPNAGVEYEFGCNGGMRPTVWRCPSCYEEFDRGRKRLGISD